MNFATTRKLVFFYLVVVLTLINAVGCNTGGTETGNALTAEQVDSNLATLAQKVTKPEVRTALTEFLSKATLQEKRDFLSGSKTLDLAVPGNATVQGGPGCHCKVTVKCKNRPGDINDCEVEVTCTGPNCEI